MTSLPVGFERYNQAQAVPLMFVTKDNHENEPTRLS
jgi:hypothetical protein